MGGVAEWDSSLPVMWATSFSRTLRLRPAHSSTSGHLGSLCTDSLSDCLSFLVRGLADFSLAALPQVVSGEQYCSHWPVQLPKVSLCSTLGKGRLRQFALGNVKENHH